ncbi:hypothetical protein H2203_006651 [Taxawa tesnikishii (nom. ined.)]|nr:hypothetical protein H2203_006651 [Dothideales sp. JES 119]
MVTAVWRNTTGWEAPEIKPYGPLTLMPTASVLHYATECFEGLKLYRGYDGSLRVFRIRKNCERMRRSALRIALPDFEPAELEKLIIKLCEVDGARWLPKDRPGSFLYIRPTMIGTDATLGVQMPREAMLFIIISCFPIPAAANQGLKLLASKEDSVRAWPGGFGFAKVGANYGPSLIASGEAQKRGYNQILWLFGPEGWVTEAGAMNIFFMWNTKEGRKQLVTAPLEGNMILEGVTRASVLDLARTNLKDEVEVVERKFTIGEIAEAVEEGRMIEAFAAGTAYFITPVGTIGWKDKDMSIPLSEGTIGAYTQKFKTWLEDIMYGRQSHEWGIVVNEQ